MHHNTSAAPDERDRGGAVVELAIVMIGVFVLLVLGLVMAVNFLAAQAASTAAVRGLQIAQTPGHTTEDATTVITRLTTASGIITSSHPEITAGPATVRVDVHVQTVLGTRISRTADGPTLRFVPQNRP